MNLHVSTIYIYNQSHKNTHPFLQVAIPTSVSLIPTPENHNKQAGI